MSGRFPRTAASGGTGAAILAGPALAAETLELGVGGCFNAFLVAVSQNDGVGETTLDNGIMFGVNVQLEAETCGDQIDESYMYVEGAFGRIEIGSEDPATDAMFYGAPQIIAGVGLDTPADVFAALPNAVATPAENEAATFVIGTNIEF